MADRRPTDLGHPAHDLELVARVAAGDGTVADVRAVDDLRARCADCRLLAEDLHAIALGVRGLRLAAPAPAPRDFRITAAGAARLRPGGVVGLLARLRSGRALQARLGGGLVALGLVGMLLGSGLSAGWIGHGAAGSAAGPEADDLKSVPTLAAGLAPVQTLAARSPSDQFGVATGAATGAVRNAAHAPGAPPSVGLAPIVIGISAAVAMIGIALLLAARGGRRAGP